jgi:hypothetical protein
VGICLPDQFNNQALTSSRAVNDLHWLRSLKAFDPASTDPELSASYSTLNDAWTVPVSHYSAKNVALEFERA